MEQVRPARQQDTKYIALLASFFLAISFWHTNFSRIGFRVISLPFFLVFSFYFLLKGFRNKKALHFILGGIFFGLGFYTYTSFRFAVLLLPVIFIPFWLNSKREDYKNLAFGKNLVSFGNKISLFFTGCFLNSAPDWHIFPEKSGRFCWSSRTNFNICRHKSSERIRKIFSFAFGNV